MKSFLITLYVGIHTLFIPCPTCDKINIKINKIAKEKLPDIINESSGLVVYKNQFYTINDSGNDSVIYILDSTFTLTNTIAIPTKNIDWEELIIFDTNKLAIGDFGNNSNKRKDLRIIKYNLESSTTQLIHFSYSNQEFYPPQKRGDQNFDCESMIWSNNNFYLFSKNKRSNNITIYKLNDSTENQIANSISQFKLNEKITATSYDSENKILAILCYGKIILYKFEDKNNSINLIPIHCKRIYCIKQTEAIAFYNKNKFFVTNEQGTIYQFKIK